MQLEPGNWTKGALEVTTAFEHILVTGGCGFIGSNFVRHALGCDTKLYVTNLDMLTYSGNAANLADVADVHGLDGDSRYRFVRGDIRDEDTVSGILRDGLRSEDRPPVDAIVHFAAETHVDRSIMGPTSFVSTNVIGTSTLVETARLIQDALPARFRFIHVSTDEVYGALDAREPAFTEETPLAPTSPYAASKAGSDLIIQAYRRTFDFPAIIVRCSNNYGPFQYPEKLIPLMITNALQDISLPVYGDGMYVRDWIHVHDHCAALWSILHDGRIGTCYNVGGESELVNLDIVKSILTALGKPESLIDFVADRPGHDRRYAMNIDRIRSEVGWQPTIDYDTGIQSTIAWYLEHEHWWRPLLPESKRVAETMYRR